ncbi:MAG: HEAT repeat domain-containing protein [Dehalococcoidia bacterium]|jgi:HEAT repeat protein
MSFQSYVEELKDPVRPLIASKLAGLSSLSPDDLALFLGAWQETAVGRRRQIMLRLGELAEDNVELNFDQVFLAGLRDEDAEVRHLAVQGLWEYEGRDLIGPLIDVLRGDPEPGVRAQAALALGRFVLRAEFRHLSEADSRRIEEALRGVIGNQEEALEVRGRALESAGALSAGWVRSSIEDAYRSRHHRLRLSAVHAMGSNCDPRWLPLLTQELGSDDAEMRYEAATACGSLCDESAVLYLKPLLDDEDAEVQEAAIAAMGEIGGADARRALKELEHHPEVRVREAVAAALEEMEFNEDPLGFHHL